MTKLLIWNLFSDKSIVNIQFCYQHCTFQDSSGIVYVSGANTNGQFGDGTITYRISSVLIDYTGAPSGKIIANTGCEYYHSFFIDITGKIYSTGFNDNGQLGDGSFFQKDSPIEIDMSGVLSGKQITKIIGGKYHTLFLDSTGKMYSTGLNDNGQLGDGTTTNRNTPVEIDISGDLSGKIITKIAAFEYHSLLLDSTGKVYSMGLNANGQLGLGTTTSVSSPTLISGLLSDKTIVQIACGENFSIFLDSKGSNTIGQLGDGTNAQRLSPVSILLPELISDKIFIHIATGSLHMILLDSTGKSYASGLNNHDQLGDGTTSNRNIIVQTKFNTLYSVFVYRYYSVGLVCPSCIRKESNKY